MRKLAALLAPIIVFMLASPSLADDALTSNGIIQKLLPTHKTRAFGSTGGALSADQAAFISGLKGRTRQITVEERTELTKVVKEADLPALDLEIYFDFDSSVISPRAVQTLIKLGQALSSDQLKSSSFVIGGHTDAKGTPDYNQRLSEARATAVKAFLAGNFQVNPQQLISVGYGQEDLKNPNAPEAAENRRVTIVSSPLTKSSPIDEVIAD